MIKKNKRSLYFYATQLRSSQIIEADFENQKQTFSSFVFIILNTNEFVSCCYISGFAISRVHCMLLNFHMTQLSDVPEPYFKVTCGSLEGKLIWQKFVCPGINVRCIRLDRSHHELITPKELVREAGKQTLKDWKRAIRINAKMLR